MLTRALRRCYQAIPGTHAQTIDCFYSHLHWMRQNRPTYAVIYFANNWNPECSEQLQREFFKSVEQTPYKTFVVNGSLGGVGERTKKYYAVRYEPTFLILIDGMEAKRVIGSDIKEVQTALKRASLFRQNVNWSFDMETRSDLWEDFHDEYMKEWRQHTENETKDYDGTMVFDRS